MRIMAFQSHTTALKNCKQLWNGQIKIFNSSAIMQKAEIRGYPRAGTSYFLQFYWATPVHKQEAGSCSAGQVFCKQDHQNFTLGSISKCHPCLLTVLVMLTPSQQKINGKGSPHHCLFIPQGASTYKNEKYFYKHKVEHGYATFRIPKNRSKVSHCCLQ